MLIIIDNFLNEEARQKISEHYEIAENCKKCAWIDGDLNKLISLKSGLSACVQQASKNFDLGGMVGVEVWSNGNSAVDWHYDKDEKLIKLTNEIKTPLCNIVYYAKVDNLIGGKLLTKTEQITPKQNRLVIFSSNTYHKVEDFQGQRIAISVNPWAFKPTGH